jgi:hypothetical protein
VSEVADGLRSWGVSTPRRRGVVVNGDKAPQKYYGAGRGVIGCEVGVVDAEAREQAIDGAERRLLDRSVQCELCWRRTRRTRSEQEVIVADGTYAESGVAIPEAGPAQHSVHPPLELVPRWANVQHVVDGVFVVATPQQTPRAVASAAEACHAAAHPR